MANVYDVTHVLAEDIALLAPFAFKGPFARDAAQVVAHDAQSGSVLSFLCRPGKKGIRTEQVIQSLTAMMQRRYPTAVASGAPQPSSGDGWTGLVQLLRVGSALEQPLRIVLTALVLPDPADSERQRNVALILEVPDVEFDRRLMHYRRFAEQRLRIGVSRPSEAARSAPSTAMALSLEPIDALPVVDDSPATGIRTDAIQPEPNTLRDEAQAEREREERLAPAARGQRAVIFSILLNFALNGLHKVPEIPVLLIFALSIALLLYSISGVLKMASGFGLRKQPKLLLMLACSLPLVNIVCWFILSTKTTRLLREAGYQVGLLGVRS